MAFLTHPRIHTYNIYSLIEKCFFPLCQLLILSQFMCKATNYLTCNVQTAQLLGKLILLVAFSICDPASFVIEKW